MSSHKARPYRPSAVRVACALFAAALAIVWAVGIRSACAQTSQPLPLSKYVHRSWSIDEGLPQGSVQAILQASDGYIWLGTQEGLVRFDGHSFDVFDSQSPTPLLANDVARLVEDRYGSLWIGSRTGGLVRYDGRTFSYLSGSDEIPSDRIQALTLTADQSLLVGTAEGGLYKLSTATFSTTQLLAPGESVISAILEASDGTIWVGTVSGQVTRIKSAPDLEPLRLPIESGTVKDIREDHDGNILVATTGSGVYRLRPDLTGESITQTLGMDITSLDVRPDGSILVGTARDGLMRIGPWGTDWFTTGDGLPHASVLSILVDSENNLWVGTHGGGVSRLYQGTFSSYSVADGLPEGSAYAVFEDASGAVWIGTETGVAVRRNGLITVLDKDLGLPEDAIISIAQTGDGSVWLGSHSSGLYRVQDGRITAEHNSSNGLPGDGIFALYTSPSGDLHIGTSNGMAVWKDEHLDTTTYANLPGKLVKSFAGDEGDLWIATYDAGLVHAVGGKIVHASIPRIDHAILSIYLDGQSTVWIGTWGGGLLRYRDGLLDAVTTESGSFNDVVFQILEDDVGNLWLSCNKGIWRLNKAEIERLTVGELDAVRSTVYDRTDGLLSREFNGGYQPAGWKGADNKLWFPSAAGVTAVDPAKAAESKHRLPVYVTAIGIGEKQVEVAHQVSVPPGEKRLELSYVGLSYRTPSRVHYRYRLDGADEDWIDAGSRRTAFYTNLSPGPYTFAVEARMSDGEWYPGEPVTITLEPFFYQTWWFYVLIAIGIALAAAGAHRWKLRSLRLRKVELERLVDEQTRDLRIEKERTDEAKSIIEKQADGLLEANAEKSQILRVVAHDLRNPLNVIREFAASLTEELSSESALKQTRLIHFSADRMLKMVAKLLQSAWLESGRVDIRRTHFAAKDVAMESIRANQLQAMKKSQRILMSSIDGRESVVNADRSLLLESLDNLISNAVKYSPQSSDIRVRVSRDGGAVNISVEDDGPGMSEEERVGLFESFRKGAARPTGGETSTGLGLSIAKKLVELNRGTIRVESELGSGCRFTISLPAATTQPGSAQRRTANRQRRSPATCEIKHRAE